jgi:hypothetical protein
VIKTRALVLYDPAYTIHFGIPLAAIIGIHEHGRNQLVGFAFLMGWSTMQFGNDLKWRAVCFAGGPNTTANNVQEYKNSLLKCFVIERLTMTQNC